MVTTCEDFPHICIIRDLAIIVSPCAFLAFNYLVYGHLIVEVDGSLKDKKERKAKSYYSYIPPRLVKHVFVWSDVITLLIQTCWYCLPFSVQVLFLTCFSNPQSEHLWKDQKVPRKSVPKSS